MTIEYSLREAYQHLRLNRDGLRYPGTEDKRCRDRVIYPLFRPKLALNFDRGASVFTIGSCFARNIEIELDKMGVDLPTRKFDAPRDEWPTNARPSGMLNEFTPGGIAQRILYALDGRSFGAEAIQPVADDLSIDLLMLRGCPDRPLQRILERRKDIEAVYARLRTADALVITLGYVEAWFDRESRLYLNRPPQRIATGPADRFVFRRLDIDDCMELLNPAFDALEAAGIKVVLTVSPVPIAATFTPEDCVTANEVSKATLRIASERLSRRPNVDYFPSYEIARTAGLSEYNDDNKHPKDSLVEKITGYMVEQYGLHTAALARAS